MLLAPPAKVVNTNVAGSAICSFSVLPNVLGDGQDPGLLLMPTLHPARSIPYYTYDGNSQEPSGAKPLNAFSSPAYKFQRRGWESPKNNSHVPTDNKTL